MCIRDSAYVEGVRDALTDAAHAGIGQSARRATLTARAESVVQAEQAHGAGMQSAASAQLLVQALRTAAVAPLADAQTVDRVLAQGRELLTRCLLYTSRCV